MSPRTRGWTLSRISVRTRARTRQPIAITGDRGVPNRLSNMSCRPDATVVHPSDDPARQLVPAFRAILPARAGLASIPVTRLAALADAVAGLLPIPAVVALADGPRLPDTVARRDVLLGLGLLARRSGPVWLRERTPAFEGIEAGGTLTLLVAPAVRERLVALVDFGGLDNDSPRPGNRARG